MTEPPEVEGLVGDAPPDSDVVLLDAPREGMPAVVVTAAQVQDAADRLRAGTGPVAVDAERASGYRYGQRAFLVQLRRAGVGTILVDPAPFVPGGAAPTPPPAALAPLADALAECEWVLHAAGQDLPCLAELGLVPRTLFDTELAARLAGMARVGLAAVVEELLGLRLAKEHSAVDWSTRPLPEPWLLYAALDVEVLLELQETLAAVLVSQGKLEWARQEFAAVVAAPPPPPRIDPWRRTSGMHKIRTRRQLAVLRELWLAREAMAQRRDVSPGRILPDRALVDAVVSAPATITELTDLPVFGGRATRRHATTWFEAIGRGRAVPEEDLPPQHLGSDGPPPPRVWAERDVAAAARWEAARPAVAGLAAELDLPVENLLSPDTLRRLAWRPPSPLDVASVASAMRDRGARAWQVELLADRLCTALATEPTTEPTTGPIAEVPTARVTTDSRTDPHSA